MTATDEQINAAIDLLRANHFVVSKPELGPWITPSELWRQIGQRLSYRGFHARLVKFPGDFPHRLGPTGRMIDLRATPALVKWLSKSQQPGAKMR